MRGGHDTEAGATDGSPVVVMAGTLVPAIGGISAASAADAVLVGVGAARGLALLARDALRRDVHAGATGARRGPEVAP
ncbi:hypothetical protein [Sorangium sp. So ce1000]|uniref:hypothetical protein n=1 Tax=Sorangium sp. So ce1000 TaxID=3133325 RepID=UPI003F624029